MHSPAIAQLTVHQRTDWEYTLFPPPTTPRPDGSWQGRCQFYDGTTLLAEPLVSILPDGSVNLRLNRVQTAIKPGQHTFDLLLESSDGKRQKQYWGTVIVQETVTRWGESPVPPPIEPEPTPAWLSDFVDEAIAAHNASLAVHPGLNGGASQLRDAFTPTNGQTIFTLATTPSLPHLSQAFLNAGKAKYGVDYIINGLLLNWMGLGLDSSDRLEIYYL